MHQPHSILDLLGPALKSEDPAQNGPPAPARDRTIRKQYRNSAISLNMPIEQFLRTSGRPSLNISTDKMPLKAFQETLRAGFKVMSSTMAEAN